VENAGALTTEQMKLLFAHMPVSFCLADEDGVVRFWAGAAFANCNPELIGLDIYAGHHAGSHARIASLLTDLRSGAKDQVSTIEHHSEGTERIIYTALRDDAGVYRGVLETVLAFDDAVSTEA